MGENKSWNEFKLTDAVHDVITHFTCNSSSTVPQERNHDVAKAILCIKWTFTTSDLEQTHEMILILRIYSQTTPKIGKTITQICNNLQVILSAQ